MHSENIPSSRPMRQGREKRIEDEEEEEAEG